MPAAKWVLSWAGHGALGAAPSRGINDAHDRLLLARRAGVCHFVKQDLTAFFDHIDIRAALMLLGKLGAPPNFVASAMVWASGVAVPEIQEIDLIRNELKAVLRPHFTDETLWFMVCAIHGWEWDPMWLYQWRVQSAGRFKTKPPAWLETVPVLQGYPTWMSVLPVAVQAIADQGWKTSPTGHAITRVDTQGVLRTFEFGCDAISVLRHWLEAAQQRALHQCGRVKRSLLDLPKPPTECHFALRGHKLLGREGPLETRRAAHATGGTTWRVAAKLHIPGQVQTTCMCEALNPSRPHLVWKCSHTENMRCGIPMPVDRAQERLFAAPLPPYPAAPSSLDQNAVVESLSQHDTRACSHLFEAYFPRDTCLHCSMRAQGLWLRHKLRDFWAPFHLCTLARTGSSPFNLSFWALLLHGLADLRSFALANPGTLPPGIVCCY